MIPRVDGFQNDFCLPMLLCYFEGRMENIAHWVSHYGYAAIFSLLVFGIVGLPVPDESLMTFAGYLVYSKHLALGPTFVSACLGSMCGITISYIIGRSIGIFVLRRYGWFFHITQKGIDKAHSWFDRFGTWTLLVGYFIPGVRHFTAIVAGTSGLRPRLFAVFAYSGAVLWSGTFIGLGFFFGEQWSRVLAEVQHHVSIVALIALMLISICAAWRFQKRDRR
jgi:membrane protein DedA with SNARE-associated domain